MSSYNQEGNNQHLYYSYEKRQTFMMFFLGINFEEIGDCLCVKPEIYAVLTKMLSEKMVSFLETSLSVTGHEFMHYFVCLNS